LIDKKDWIQNRCEEIALETLGREYYDLDPNLQLMCYAIAEQDWTDYYSSQIDAIYESLAEQLLPRVGIKLSMEVKDEANSNRP